VYLMPSFAKDVTAVLDAEHVDKAVLVGHSMGGMVVLHAADSLGDHIVGLVGADTFKYLRDDPRLGKQSDQLRELEAGYKSVVAGVVSSMFADDTPQSVKSTITRGMLATPEFVGYGSMKGMADDEPLFDLAARLDIPMMTINATGRPMDATAARDAGVDVRLLPTNGHFVMNEDPPGFNLLLTEALTLMV
jgi:pimeloyl-ACP methyl ester carboxylesterase